MVTLQAIAKLGQKVYYDFTHDLTINTIGDTEGHLCNSDYNLMFDEKWYEHIANENEKMFGCTVPWHPQYHSKTHMR